MVQRKQFKTHNWFDSPNFFLLTFITGPSLSAAFLPASSPLTSSHCSGYFPKEHQILGHADWFNLVPLPAPGVQTHVSLGAQQTKGYSDLISLWDLYVLLAQLLLLLSQHNYQCPSSHFQKWFCLDNKLYVPRYRQIFCLKWLVFLESTCFLKWDWQLYFCFFK